MTYDTDVLDSIRLFVLLGINPGSFGTALLQNDRERGYQCAHPLLKPEHNRNGEDVVANMFYVTKDLLPPFLFGNKTELLKWESHQGLLDAPVDTKVEMYLKYERTAWFMGGVNQEWIEYLWDPTPLENRPTRPSVNMFDARHAY
jgi:hypothetical protein